MSFLKKLTITIMGLRKWSIMILIIAIGTSFRISELLTGVQYVDLIKGVAIAFMSSNAFEHIKDMFGSKTEKPDKD